MTKEELYQRYSTDQYDERVKEYLHWVINELYLAYGLDDSYIISLDLLATNFQIYFVGFEDILKNGAFVRDDKDRLQRNPAITLMTSSLNNIQRILGNFGLTLLAKSKLKLQKTDSGNAFIEGMLK